MKNGHILFITYSTVSHNNHQQIFKYLIFIYHYQIPTLGLQFFIDTFIFNT